MSLRDFSIKQKLVALVLIFVTVLGYSVWMTDELNEYQHNGLIFIKVADAQEMLIQKVQKEIYMRTKEGKTLADETLTLLKKNNQCMQFVKDSLDGKCEIKNSPGSAVMALLQEQNNLIDKSSDLLKNTNNNLQRETFTDLFDNSLEVVKVYTKLLEETLATKRDNESNLLLLSLAIALLLAYFIVTDLANEVDIVLKSAKNLSVGKFDPIEIRSVDEIGEIADAFNLTITRLKAMFYGQDIEWSEMLEAKENSAKLNSMLENNASNILFAGPDGVIEYVNPASYKSFEIIKDSLPVDISEVKGSNYDIFHKTPEQIRKLVGDPKNLPHNARIQVGEEILDLIVSATYNELGDYIGPMLTWSIVTERVKLEMDNSKIRAMAENVPINIMTSDLNGVITYINPASQVTFQGLSSAIPIPVSQIVGSNYDIFHSNPGHQRAILSDPANLPYAANVSLCGEMLALNASAIFDKDGVYVGPMVTWEVITDRLEKERVAKEMTANIKNVLSQVSSTAESLGDSSNDLAGISSQMSATSEETSAQASGAAVAAEEVSANVQAVAAAAEEMSASISEIAKSTNGAAQIAIRAVKVAEETTEDVNRLGNNSQEIGNVIKSITAIAEQTNLLALNATIEAARAGEAGKGFGVVANEVKELANETAKATDDISGKIASIQSDVKQVVEAIGGFRQIIEEINEAQVSIASAVEEQAATMHEITNNASQAANGSNEIAINVNTVAIAAEDTNKGANQTQAAAKNLSGLAQELTILVDQA
ncbi:MAG: methyl-accepting chemotaxis protein [Candidatus Cloacimonetes bacterium]|nr:methyl-accepting chemotaxis protein [Candidatus Cloacimonadota bacterium]